jgi:hypothetical protein
VSFLPQHNPADFQNWDNLASHEWRSLVPYLNSTNWAQFDPTSWPLYICKDSMGFVHMRGLFKSVAAYAFATPSTLIMMTLPKDLCPIATHMGFLFQADSAANNAILRTDLTPDGKLTITNIAFPSGAGGNTGLIVYAKWLVDPWYAPYQTP